MNNKHLAIIFLLISQAACRPEAFQKIKVGLPAYSPVRADAFREIIITDFLEEAPAKDYDLNRDLRDYLEREASRGFTGKITRQGLTPAGGEVFGDKEFWIRAGSGRTDAVFLTGKAGMAREVRKSLKRTGPDLEDSPFKIKPWTLVEKEVFTLSLHVYLIRAAGGEVLYDREISETVGYENGSHDEAFAFYELLQGVRHKIFRRILGEEVVQQRYLLTR